MTKSTLSDALKLNGRPGGPPLKASNLQGGSRPQDARTPSFQAICFDCFLLGHRRPLFPHLDRTIVDPAFKEWVFLLRSPGEMSTSLAAINLPSGRESQHARYRAAGNGRRTGTNTAGTTRRPPTSSPDPDGSAKAKSKKLTRRLALRRLQAEAFGAELPPAKGGPTPPTALGSPLHKVDPRIQVEDTTVALTSPAPEKRLPPNMQPPSLINIMEAPFVLPTFIDL